MLRLRFLRAKVSVALPKIATAPHPRLQGALETALVGHQHGTLGAAAQRTEPVEHLGGVGQLRHPGRRHEGRGLDGLQPRRGQPLDERSLDVRRNDRLLVLQTVARAHLVDRDARGQVGSGLALRGSHAHAPILPPVPPGAVRNPAGAESYRLATRRGTGLRHGEGPRHERDTEGPGRVQRATGVGRVPRPHRPGLRRARRPGVRDARRADRGRHLEHAGSRADPGAVLRGHPAAPE